MTPANEARRLAQGIARAWGPAWTAVEIHDHYSQVRRASDGAAIAVIFWPSRGARAELAGVWPKMADGRTYPPRDEEKRRITVDPARDIAQIAADVARRLLPHYLSAYARTRSECALHDAQEREALEAVRRIAAAFSSADVRERKRPADLLRFYAQGANGEVHPRCHDEDGPTVDLRLSVTPDEAIAIAYLLRDARGVREAS